MTEGTATPDDREPGAEEQQGPTIRDRRRIDPVTGELRIPPEDAPVAEHMKEETTDSATQVSDTQPETGGQADHADSQAGEGTQDLASVVAELEKERDNYREDLKRLQAEYVNYKRRVDRDRDSVRTLAVGGVLTDLLPVVDDIGRAREHGELEGGFKAVAEALEATLAKLGLEQYGEAGDPFDPNIHEALMHQYSDEVDGPTCHMVLQPGYKHGDRVLRPARVAVAEPTTELASATPASAEESPAESASDAGDGEQAPDDGDTGTDGRE